MGRKGAANPVAQRRYAANEEQKMENQHEEGRWHTKESTPTTQVRNDRGSKHGSASTSAYFSPVSNSIPRVKLHELRHQSLLTQR